MNKIKKLSKTTFVLLLVVALLSVALAVVIMQRSVDHSVVVVLHRDFRLYQDYDCTVELTAIDWDEMYRNDALNKTFYAKNLGEATIYVSWNATGLDSKLQLKMYWSGYESADPPDNTYQTWTYDTHRETLPVSSVRAIRFELKILGTAPEGALGFTETFYGHDVET
jgi:hypothetical protein